MFSTEDQIWRNSFVLLLAFLKSNCSSQDKQSDFFFFSLKRSFCSNLRGWKKSQMQFRSHTQKINQILRGIHSNMFPDRGKRETYITFQIKRKKEIKMKRNWEEKTKDQEEKKNSQVFAERKLFSCGETFVFILFFSLFFDFFLFIQQHKWSRFCSPHLSLPLSESTTFTFKKATNGYQMDLCSQPTVLLRVVILLVRNNNFYWNLIWFFFY